MSPEQMTLGVTNKMTDIYSFGMTIYEIFTNLPPFANTPDILLLPLIVDRKQRPPRPADSLSAGRGLNDSIWALVEECWTHDPDQRPAAALVSSQLEGHSVSNMVAPEMTESLNTQPVPVSSVPIDSTLEPSHAINREENFRAANDGRASLPIDPVELTPSTRIVEVGEARALSVDPLPSGQHSYRRWLWNRRVKSEPKVVPYILPTSDRSGGQSLHTSTGDEGTRPQVDVTYTPGPSTHAVSIKKGSQGPQNEPQIIPGIGSVSVPSFLAMGA
ncbi:hypothetical protein BOTBODRAFT_634144, partial [Botryobasidium botryosum FD-172 SS1]